MTRAVSVIVERSPGGGSAYHVRVDGKAKFLMRTTEAIALEFAARKLGLLGAGPAERARVVALLLSELRRLRRAEVTAEIPANDNGKAVA